eukprot:2711061-Pyramimonas_sp.AAC.1
MQEYIKGIADTGAKVVVGNGSFGEMAMHFIEQYGLMAIKIPSKFELRRFCRATGAVALVKVRAERKERSKERNKPPPSRRCRYDSAPAGYARGSART